MKQSAQKKTKSNKRVLVGLAAGFIGTGMLISQAQAAAYVDPYMTGMIDLSFGLEEMSGDMTSAIGGEINHANGQTEHVRSTISELEWPMDTLLARFDGSLTLNSLWRINATLKTAVDDPDDTMIDRDWLNEDRWADIYSESSISSFDAVIWDIDLEWTYLQQGPWSFSAGIGYQKQDFEYKGDLIRQSSPTGMPGYDYPGDGSTGITYENTFSMFYFLLGADVQLTSQFELAGKFSVAPLASSEDELHHLYYNKVSTGDMDGTAYMFEVSGTFQISPWWFVEAGVQLTDISVDGDQYQVLAGEPLGQIDQEIESDQGSVYITMGYSF